MLLVSKMVQLSPITAAICVDRREEAGEKHDKMKAGGL
jgi:hypothetical protein